jgi:hypothetical protein
MVSHSSGYFLYSGPDSIISSGTKQLITPGLLDFAHTVLQFEQFAPVCSYSGAPISLIVVVECVPV